VDLGMVDYGPGIVNQSNGNKSWHQISLISFAVIIDVNNVITVAPIMITVVLII
jgi:hypothetical protein